MLQGIKALQRNPTPLVFAEIVEAAHPQEGIFRRWWGWVRGWLQAFFPTFPQKFPQPLASVNGSQ